MDPTASFQPKQDLVVIKADLDLLERTKKKTENELEQLNKTKTEALRMHEHQVTQKKTEAEHWKREGERLQNLCHLYSQSVEDLEKLIKEKKLERTQLIQKTTDEVQQIHDDAKNREEAVTGREKNVTLISERTKKDVEIVTRTLRAIALREKKLTADRQVLKEEQKQHKAMVELSKLEVAKAQRLLDDIDRQLAEKREEKRTLEVQITQQTKHAETIGKEANSRLTDVKRRESVVVRKEIAANERDEKQNQREIKLADREATVGRAYRETIQRGGRVN